MNARAFERIARLEAASMRRIYAAAVAVVREFPSHPSNVRIMADARKHLEWGKRAIRDAAKLPKPRIP
jgi:hypothetical protein